MCTYLKSTFLDAQLSRLLKSRDTVAAIKTQEKPRFSHER